MRIIVDCFKLVKGYGKSIGIYNHAKNFVKYISEENVAYEIIVLGYKMNKKDFNLPNIKFVEIGFNPLNKFIFVLWELFWINLYVRRFKADILLFPRGYLPLKSKAISIIIVHDLIPFYYQRNYPEYINKLESFYIRKRLLSSIKKANKVITVSNFSKNQIIDAVKNSKEKIQVIYNGYNYIENKYDKNNEENIQGENYMLAITSELPHKNFDGIIKSYGIYYQNTTKPLNLKVVGIKNKTKYLNIIPKTIEKNIELIGFLNDIEFYNLFGNARIFIFLSIIEGFGFPPLEAMNLGVPVLCSNSSSLPEIINEAGILVDCTDYKDVAINIEKLCSDEKLRNELIKKGYKNIERFNWKDRIKEYIEIINKVYNDN